MSPFWSKVVGDAIAEQFSTPEGTGEAIAYGAAAYLFWRKAPQALGPALAKRAPNLAARMSNAYRFAANPLKRCPPLDLEAGQARNLREIQNVITKLEGEKGGLARHLRDVRRERAGEAVSMKSGGDPHSHIQEIREARTALRTRVNRLKNSLQNPAHSAAVREYVQAQIEQAEAIIQQMDEALGK